MTQTQFWTEVHKQKLAHKEWRDGQTLFNTLYTHRPDISEVIRATPNDPFYAKDIYAPEYMAACEVIDMMWEKD